MEQIIDGSNLLSNSNTLPSIAALQANTTLTGGYIYISNVGFYFGNPALQGLSAKSDNSIVVDKNGTRWVSQPQLSIITQNDTFPLGITIPAGQTITNNGTYAGVATFSPEITANAGITVPIGQTVTYYAMNDPKYWGATGNGTTDDTTSLQNWINYLQANNVTGHLSAGTYNITNNLTVSQPINIYGDGTNRSVITNGNTALTGAILNITATEYTGHLDNFTLTSAAVNTSLNAITFNNPSENFIISGLIITNLYDGIYFAATQYGGVVKDVIVQNCVNGFVVDAGNLSMSNCYASDNSHYGFFRHIILIPELPYI